MPPAEAPPAHGTLHSTPAGWESCPDGQHSKDQQQKQSVRTSREVDEMALKGPSSLLVLLSSHIGHRLEGTEILTPDCHFSTEPECGFGGEGHKFCPFLQPQCPFPALPLHEARPQVLWSTILPCTFISDLHAGVLLSFSPGPAATVGNPQETE